MHVRNLAGALATVVVLIAATTAYSQYYPSPSPPPSSQSSPSGLGAVKAQAKVAAAHASYAAEGTTVTYAKEHLGHALVCIEGPKGNNVKPFWENPCQGMGNGVLVDLQRMKASASLLQQAKTADAAAIGALQSTDLAKIKAAAKRVSTLMRELAK